MIKRAWQESKFDGLIGRWAAVYATMNPMGHIYMTGRTFELLGEPAAFRLLFDRVNATIGVQPTGRTMKNAYEAKKRGHHRGRVIRALSFIEEFGIRLDETVFFTNPIIDEEGILVLDLRKTRSGAKPKRSADSAE